jgi:Tfp pilus assembly protein PilF
MAEGRELFAAESYPLALVKFRQVLAHDPFHVAALGSRAEIHQKLGQIEKAGHCRRRAKLLHQQGAAEPNLSESSG